MIKNASQVVARLLWIFPALLLFLTVYLGKAAIDLYETLHEGVPAVAEVTELEISNRVDVTYDYVSLRVALPDGQVIERERLSLPHSLAPSLAGQSTLQVRVRPGAEQEVVIERIARPQWRIALTNAVMSFIAFVIGVVGVGWWNRYLSRQGDPAQQEMPLTG